ncbi:MAG: PilZ domain-containing protein [Elusimicrobia bacterium]|nr:PilZ domain-containing protein [Elusimicrobiota bacterium]
MADSKGNSPSRRLHARFPCRIPVRIVQINHKNKLDAVLLNVGMGGALAAIEAQLEGDSVMLEFPKEHGGFYAEAVVTRHSGRDAKNPKLHLYGLTIRMHAGSPAENRFRALVDRVRTAVNTGPQVRRDYWSI